jgi:uncharacterized protein YukJ
MPLKHYGVLKATPVDRRLGTGANPHYQILAVDNDDRYRLAVNVRSKLSPSELQYLIIPNFQHPIIPQLQELGAGWHPLPSKPGGAALDFIRGNLFSFNDMVPLPFNLPGPDNDLNEKIDHYVQRSMADQDSWVFAFGEPWGPEQIRDKIFGFAPGRGVHDIHMNQGNSGSFIQDDGVWQDGGIIFWFPSQSQWVAIFLKFQSQAIHTDDRTGHAIAAEIGGPPADSTGPTPHVPLWPPTQEVPDGLVRIVAAQVNSQETPEDEVVLLLNASPQSIDLEGWALADSQKRKKLLNGLLKPKEPLLVHVRPEIELSNKGGIITLLNEEGLKVDGVSYTREQAKHPGWTIVF